MSSKKKKTQQEKPRQAKLFSQKNQQRSEIIKEATNLDRYGVLLLKTEWIEKIQKLSGQNGPFTKEWQFHYWFASTRKQTDTQTLDIAIPLCFYNYPQEVTGAHIDFELPDVTEAKDDSYQEALLKFQEFSKTDLFNILSNMFGDDWKVYGYSNIHTHPNGVNSFSPTDLNKSEVNPGVVYPLDTGNEIPHFTGIQMHIEDKCELIHNEFRVFNRIDNIKFYEYGRCLTICSGFEEDYKEPEKKQETEIDLMFGQSRWQPPAKKPPKIRKDKFLIDNFKQSDQLMEFANSFLELIKTIDYEPAYKIDKKLIQPRKLKQHSLFGTYGNSYDMDDYSDLCDLSVVIPFSSRTTEVQKKIKELVSDEYMDITYRDTTKMSMSKINELYEKMISDEKNSKQTNKFSKEHRRMIEELVDLGLEVEDLLDMNFKEFKELYDDWENDVMEDPDDIRASLALVYDDDEIEMIIFLMDVGFEYEELESLSKTELERLAKTYIEEIDNDDDWKYETLVDAENYLLDNKILTEKEMDQMTDVEILSAYEKMKGNAA